MNFHNIQDKHPLSLSRERDRLQKYWAIDLIKKIIFCLKFQLSNCLLKTVPVCSSLKKPKRLIVEFGNCGSQVLTSRLHEIAKTIKPANFLTTSN